MAAQSRVKSQEFSWQIGGVKKKRHGHNFPNWGSILNQRGKKWVSLTLIQYGASILKIVAVSFFLNANYFWGRTQNFRLCWLWPAITRVQNIGAWKTITFSDSSGRQLSHGTPHVGSTRSECPVNVGNTKKYHFSCFWASRRWKKVGGRRSDNFDATAPAHGSFWPILPTFLMGINRNDDTLRFWGTRPPQSWKNQICVSKKTWFGGYFLDKIIDLTHFEHIYPPPWYTSLESYGSQARFGSELSRF